MIDARVLASCRVTHEQAPVGELVTACRPDPNSRLDALRDAGATEAFVLQTCNRAEAYAVAEDEQAAKAACEAVEYAVLDDIVVRSGHEESLRHLLRVATGLESIVVGEHQILGQVRDAYHRANEAGAVGNVLEPALLKAIHLGERARDETAIDEGPTSLAGAAVRLVAREHPIQRTLIVGAGEMGERAARAFAVRNVGNLSLVNRTRLRAETLAADLDASPRVVPFDELSAALDRADAVITATDSEKSVVDADMLSDAGRTAVVDLAWPRDVSPSVHSLDSVVVYDMDDLKEFLETTQESRADAEARVTAMVEDALEQLIDRHKRERVDGVISTIHQGAERIKRRELETALSQLESHGTLTDKQREDVEALSDALISQLLAPPTESLREAAAADDWETIATAIQLFDPDLDEKTKPFDGVPDANVSAVENESGQD